MSILKLIAADNYISVNKYIAKCLGLNEAIILGELASRQDYYQQINELEEGFFYETVQKLEENTTLKESVQRKAIQHLYTLGIIDVCYKGLPQKRYFRINERKLLDILEENKKNNCFEKEGTSAANYKALAPLRTSQYKNNNKNNYNREVDNNQTIPEKHKEITELTVEELKQLKHLVLENRDTQTITYREIQKKFNLIDPVTYDTPTICSKLIKQTEDTIKRINSTESCTGFSEEIF